MTAATPTTTPPTPPPIAALRAENLSIAFGGLKAVDGLSIDLPAGALHGLIGPNGAGKTTCFNLLTGVYRPDSGHITVAGRRVDGRRPYAITEAGVARTFQNIRLFPDLSVLDNVKIACHLRTRHSLVGAILRTRPQQAQERQITARCMALLERFNLHTRAGEQATGLPYGDQRRLEIARALATEPRVLLLDEPAAGMNPQEKIALRSLIRQIQSDFDVAILLIEHDMGVVMGLCEQITVLDHGVPIATGVPEAIQKNPAVIEAYLGAPE